MVTNLKFGCRSFEPTVELLRRFEVPMAESHLSSTSAWQLVESLNSAHVHEDKELLLQAPFVGIAMDESTSIDLHTYLSVEATMYIPRVGRRQLFLKLQQLDKADAAGVTAAMQSVLQEFGIDSDKIARKLIGVAADGASTFQGEFTGVISRVQSGLAPYLIGTHCPAHRLNLAAKSLDDCLLERLVQITTVVNTHFCKSSKRMQAYEQVQVKLSLPQHK